MAEQDDWPVATENIYFNSVLAYAPGHRVPPDNVTAHGWQDKVAPAESPEAEEVAAVLADDFESLTVLQLRELLTERGLDSNGTKAELVDRLRGASVG